MISPKDQIGRRRLPCSEVLLFVALVIFGTGCGGRGIRHKIEAEIAKSIENRLGPAKSYSVNVKGSTLSIIRGNLREVRVSAEQVHLREVVTLERLDVVLEDLIFDSSSRSIRKCSRAYYTAVISAEELEKYICKRYSDIPELRLQLVNHELRIEAAPQPAGIRIPITANALLRSQNGTQVVIDLKKIDVGPIPTPGFAREFLEKRLNPVFEASDFGFDARIDEVRIENSSLVLTGKFDPVKAFDKPN